MAGSLEKYAIESTTTIHETDFFAKAAPPKELVGETALLNTAFTLKKGELSSLLEGKDGYAILYVTETKEPVIPPLEEVKTAVEKDFIADRAKTMAKEAADKLLSEAKTASAFAEATTRAGAKLNTTPFYSRSNQTASGLPAAIADQGLNLTGANPYPAEAATVGTNFYVIHFAESLTADETDFAAQKETIAQNLKQEQQIKIMEAWLGYLRDKADITVNQNLLQ
ncbi:MAG: peptidyl-prolyl cis-trans isomerase [Desulfobulbaceae bacterium]|nr:peptidyl-prolyl cis-trans isomerase [Desulfobulbaceae bacterium]